MLAGIILAGATPVEMDPLAAATGVSKKSLIPIAGRPMVSYVYDALDAVERIGFIVVVGLTEADGVPFSEKAVLHPGFGDLLDNGLGALDVIRGHDSDVRHAVIASSDIPLVTSDVVDALIDACTPADHDLCYTVIEQSVMEVAYPNSGRSFRRFGEKAYAGGDLHMVSTGIDHANIERIRQAVSSRKSGLAQARALGLKTLVKFALGRLTLDETVDAAQRVFGLSGRVIVSPHASLGMDVDKPHQLELVRGILETGQQRANVLPRK